MAQKVEEQIWTAIHGFLVAGQVGGQPLDYVKNILEGFQNIAQGGLPALIMEPANTEEQPHTSSRRVRLTDRINIHCILDHMNVAKGIIGVDPNKGIKDLVGDTKNVIATNLKLGLAASGILWVRFPITDYVPIEQTYPQREAIITVEVDATMQDDQR